MPNRYNSHAMPSSASQMAIVLSMVGSGALGAFARRVGDKARSSLCRKMSSFCCLIRSGNRKRFLARTVSGSGIEFTGGSLGVLKMSKSHHTKGMPPASFMGEGSV